MKLRSKGLLGRITPADTFLFIILIIISVSGLVFINEVLPKGTEVVIEVDGKPAYTLPLYESRTVEVKGINGTTVVEIRNNKVHVTESPCPDKLCIKQGWIDKGALICLPNRIIVRMNTGTGKIPQIDAVTR